ncbi:Gp37-like protein [Lactococcus lactis]
MQRILLTYQWLGDFNYAKAKIFDGFESLIIYENYGKCNTFELDLPFSFENNAIFKPENVFKFDGVYYYVDDVSGTNDKLKICGKSLAGKYDSRIIDRTYIASKSPALIAWDHINQEIINPGNYSDINGSYNGADRKIDYLTLGNRYLHTAYANSADGTDGFTTIYPNLNLLDGTKGFSGTWVNLDFWVTDGTYKDLTVKKRTGKGPGFYKVFTAPADGTYTFSSYLKSSGNGGNIRRWVNTNDVDGVGTIDMASNFDWKIDTFSAALKAGDKVFVRYEITSDNTGLDIWNAGHKWEQGLTATPYMPSASEVTTADWPSFIGQYSDYGKTGSTTPSDYDWSTFSGSVPVPIENPKVITDLGLASIDYQNSYGEVQKQVETLCETYNFGFKEVGAKGVVSNQIQFFKGRDVSKWVVFSDDSDGYENLNEVEFEHSTFDKKTVAYAFGEGEGSDRKKIVLNPTIKGLYRRELYVDARDLQSSDGTTTIPAATYNNMLKDRANQALSDKKEVITLNGDFVLTSKLVQFGRDFFVGDTVRLTSKRYGAAKTAVISQAKKTYNDKGEYLELIYDKETPTIFDILGRNK